MKKLAIVFIGFFLIAFSMNVSGQASETGTANAKILTPITLSQEDGLSFGEIAAGTGNSVVVINENTGARSQEAGGTATLYSGDEGGRGVFEVTGETGETFQITIDASTSLSDGSGNSLNITEIVTTEAGNIGTITGGTMTFGVGAKLTVPSTAVAGTYSGSYNVSVNYN